MKYSELLVLYKTGKLPEDEAKKVESDIERHVAIGDYLFEDEKIPELTDMFEENEDNENQKVVKLVRDTMRATFIKLGAIVTAIVLVVALFIAFALPKVVDCFYYNPAKELGPHTEALSLDMAVYSELHMPTGYCDHAFVESEGYGKYSFVLQTFGINYEDSIGGTINKNKITLYDPDYFSYFSVNNFNYYGVGVDCGWHLTESSYFTKEERIEQYKEELVDGEDYIVYVTFNEVLSYQEFVSTTKMLSVNPYWAGICTKDDKTYTSNYLTGFIYNNSCRSLAFDEKKYPYLTQFSLCLSRDIVSEEPVAEDVMTTHMVSMLKYMADQKQFRKAIDGWSSEKYLEMAANVEEHGLNIYGYMDVVDKETVLRLLESDSILYVTVEQ